MRKCGVRRRAISWDNLGKVLLSGEQSRRYWPAATRLGPSHPHGTPQPLGISCPPELLTASGLKPLTPYAITDPGRLMRELAAVRRAGIAIESQESVLGNACVAAPIFDSDCHPVAAVSVSGPPMRLRPAQRASLLRRTAIKITQQVGGRLPEGRR